MAVTTGADDPREMLAAAGAAIVAGVEQAGPAWSVRNVDRILDAWDRIDAEHRADIRVAAARAGAAAAQRVAARGGRAL